MVAMDIILSVASKIGEYTVAPVGRQIGYIIFYKSNLERLKSEVQKLDGAKDTVQHSVDEAKRNGEEIENNVKNWLKKVDETVAEAKKLCDSEGHAKVECSMRHFLNLRTRHQLSRKTKKMTRDLKVLSEGKFDRISYRAAPQVTVMPFARGYEALDSRTSMLNEMKQVLKDPDIYMIGVYGMGGVGKTTLVKELAWQAEKDESFGAVVMATITNSSDVKIIQGQIADGLGLKFEEETKEGRARRLHQRITNEKSILVILDDIWDKLDLAEVGIPIGDDHKGCKLVLTSRDLKVLNCEMGTQKDFSLEVLSEKDSWNLFEKMAGDAVKDANIKPVAVKVAKCCAGLPLLIVTVAKALRKKDVYAWKDSLHKLKRYDHEGLYNKAYPTLELSYNCLESDELKSLFLLIGSVGLDRIHTGKLFVYCWGLGLFRHVDTLTEARNRYYTLINGLRASSLLLEREIEWVRVHDLVRDVAKSIASRSHPTYAVQRFTEIKEWPKMDQLQKCHYIVLPQSHIRELPEKLECPELKMLVLENENGYLKVPDNLFSAMGEVKVIELHRMRFTPSPPPSLPLLTNLQSLNLSGCMLGDISIVAELKSLEILILERAEIEELPKEIRHLTQLRMLNFSSCRGLRVIPINLLSSLTCLEELYMGNCKIQWELEGSENQSNNASLCELRNLHRLTTLDLSIQDASILPSKLHVLPKLERYNIFIGNSWEWSLQWSGGACESSRTLKLLESLSTNIFLDREVKLLLTTVEDLSLDKLKSVRNVLPELNEEGFLQLKHLHVLNSDELLHVIKLTKLVQPRHAFPNLETLVLDNLINMEEICYGPVQTQSFDKLKVIKVKGCDKLKNLLLYSIASNLSQLLEMEISKCKFMKEIIAEEKLEDGKEFAKIVFPKLQSLSLDSLPRLLSFCFMSLATNMKNRMFDLDYKDKQSLPQALIDEKVAMPNLETMKLSRMNICKIWDDKLPALSCNQNLTSLKVYRCDSLTSLFSSSVARSLVKLNYLQILDCRMLENIFVQEEKLDNLPLVLKPLSSEQVTFPNLETLIIIGMINLKSMWHDQWAPNSFCKLNKLEIGYCPKLLNVFPSYMLNNLHNLETLEVYFCDALEVVLEIQELNAAAASPQGQGLATRLRTLYLSSLPMLKCIWSKDPHGSLRFQNLCTVKVSHCKSLLDHVFPMSVAEELQQLQVLAIWDCAVEKIVGSENEGDASGEVAFSKLEKLELANLPGLTCFCKVSYSFKFPSLQTVRVWGCPMMETFSYGIFATPTLTQVQLGYSKQVPFDGDLNTTLRKIFNEENSKQEDLSLSSESEG